MSRRIPRMLRPRAVICTLIAMLAAAPAAWAVNVSGNITTNTTWTLANSPYIVTGSVLVLNNATLTIQPGVQVKFNANTGLTIGSGNAGTLIAQGTAAQPILFTSNNATPAPGQWNGITFMSTATAASILEYCTVQYGGAGTNDADVFFNFSQAVTIRRCTVRSSDGAGLKLTAAKPVIEHNTITSNGQGIRITANQGQETIRHNTITGNTGTGLTATIASTAVTARVNWWGQASGPSGIGPGTGSSIAGNVKFEPWLTQAPTDPFRWTDASNAPDPFSQPNGATTFFGTLQQSANWTITIKDSASAVVRTLTGTGASVGQDWNGTNTGGATLANGTYSYDMTATSVAGGLVAAPARGSVVLNSAVPAAAIISPTQGQTFLNDNPIIITGTASATNFQTYSVKYGVGASPATFTTLILTSTPVTNGTLATLNPQGLAPGVYTIRLTVTNQAAVSTIVDRQVTLNHVQVSAVSVSPSTIDPYTGQTSTIQYTLGETANVTVRIYDDITKVLIRALTASNQTSGVKTMIWDGKNANAQIAPLTAYYFTIEAIDPANANRKGTYNNATTPAMGVTPIHNTYSVSPSSYDPYKNDLVQIGHSMTGPGHLSIFIWDSTNTAIRQIQNQEVELAGAQTDFWDGRKDNGAVHSGAFDVFFDIPLPLPVNYMVLRHTGASFDAVRAEAYVIQPTFDEVSRINYTLPVNANVTLTIVDPNGNTVRTLLSNVAQTAGAQTVEWNGRTDAGQVVTLEGEYRVVLAGTQTPSGFQFSRTGIISVHR